MIYSSPEPDPFSCNFWETHVDEQTGKPQTTPKRLTDWAGFCMDNFSATADGKRLAFHRWSTEGGVYVVGLAAGWRITTPRQMTLAEGWPIPSAWTADSRALVFMSYRNGSWGIFMQSLGSDRAEPIVAGLSNSEPGRVSPDGAWVLFISSTKKGGPPPAELMRAPLTGELAQPVFTVQRDAQLRCAKSPAKLCAISEKTPDRKRLAFTAFDPVAGRGQELIRLDADPNAVYAWDLSPEGTRIAVVKSSGGPIRVFPLNGGPARELEAKGWSTADSYQTLEWAADGKGLLVSGYVQGDLALLGIDLEGNAHVLWRPGGTPAATTIGVPSPDGRHLAILNWSIHGNIWMMENF
jgi:hypothetical protein